MEDSNLKKIRLEKLEKLKSLGITPYPHNFDKKQTIGQSHLMEGTIVKTAGRIISFREHGNIAFAHLRDETGKIQIFFQKKLLEEKFNLVKLLDLGDFIGVEGEVVRTVAGEISIAPTEVTFLGKALLPLPSEWYGIKDTETRYRQRYLDLLLNEDVRERFNIRTKVVSGVREYLDNLGFWEVETPTLQTLYGGANAKPFKTHLNALDQDMFLRIADELYLKRLVVGGYERVYEICKDFRNEGVDHTHFPEFTMLEWYESYADYQKVMDRAEELLKFLSQKLYNTTILKIEDKEVDIGKKWPRISMVNVLREKLNLDVEDESSENLLAFIKNRYPEIKLAGGESKGQLIYAIFEHAIPKLLTEPTWIIDYPQEVSPLAKSHRSKPGWVERFEGYLGGKEIFDGWSELNDPSVQRSKLAADSDAARLDKTEAQHMDEDFIEAMEYGMPPFGGIGIGIDRLAMLLTNTWAVKEVILFPSLRPDARIAKEIQKLQNQEIGKSTVNVLKKEQSISLKQDFSRKIVVVVNQEVEKWQAMNAIAHTSAYLGNKMQEQFDTGGDFVTKDNIGIPKNSQYAIIALSASSSQMHKLIRKVRESGLLYHAFIKDMFENDDTQVQKTVGSRSDEEIEYLAIGVFGSSEDVDKLTKGYPLFK